MIHEAGFAGQVAQTSRILPSIPATQLERICGHQAWRELDRGTDRGSAIAHPSVEKIIRALCDLPVRGIAGDRSTM